MRWKLRILQWVLLLLDTALIWSIFICYDGYSHSISNYIVMSLCYAVIIMCLYAFRGYDLARSKSLSVNLISRFQGLVTAAFICSFIFFFAQKGIPRSRILLYSAIVFLMLTLSRSLFFFLIKNSPIQEAIIVGSREKWDDLGKEISDSVLNKVIPVCYCLPDIGAIEECTSRYPGARLLIVIDPLFLSKANIRRRINHLRDKNIRVEYLPNVVERYLERIPLSSAKEFSGYYEIALNTVSTKYMKRAFDIAFSVIGLIIGIPFMIVIALWILIEDGRPVIFSQERVGMNGRKYIMHKFRSMKNTPADAKEPAFATQEQSRILNPIGKIIRKTRFDELPQLWDVLIGNMSLIGPRPEQPRFVEQFSDELPFYDYRHHARPGITGWAQVKYRYAASLEETARKLEYDLYYVKNWSILLDLSIILKTVATVLGMEGSK